MACILLIDDDDLLRNVLSKALTHAGHTVLQAEDGAQGLDIFRATNVDLVLTDLIMPVREGVETIMTLKRERPNLPIIAMSGDASNSALYLSIAAKIGAKHILPKPFTPQELLQVIDGVLPKP
ncbi:MAG: response regulator [Opitutaceae bacterium]|nr:response regulator [Opitutaceae bacterium]